MWRSRLSDAAFNAIYDEFNWEGTVFQSIYDATNDIDALALTQTIIAKAKH